MSEDKTLLVKLRYYIGILQTFRVNTAAAFLMVITKNVATLTMFQRICVRHEFPTRHNASVDCRGLIWDKNSYLVKIIRFPSRISPDLLQSIISKYFGLECSSGPSRPLPIVIHYRQLDQTTLQSFDVVILFFIIPLGLNGQPLYVTKFTTRTNKRV